MPRARAPTVQWKSQRLLGPDIGQQFRARHRIDVAGDILVADVLDRLAGLVARDFGLILVANRRGACRAVATRPVRCRAVPINLNQAHHILRGSLCRPKSTQQRREHQARHYASPSGPNAAIRRVCASRRP